MKTTDYLKETIKQLAEQSRQTRATEKALKGDGFYPFFQMTKEEQSAFFDYVRAHHHRTWRLRNQARWHHLAYAYLRGVPYRKVEQKTHVGQDNYMKYEGSYAIAKIVMRYQAKVDVWSVRKEVHEWLKVPAMHIAEAAE